MTCSHTGSPNLSTFVKFWTDAVLTNSNILGSTLLGTYTGALGAPPPYRFVNGGLCNNGFGSNVPISLNLTLACSSATACIISLYAPCVYVGTVFTPVACSESCIFLACCGSDVTCHPVGGLALLINMACCSRDAAADLPRYLQCGVGRATQPLAALIVCGSTYSSPAVTLVYHLLAPGTQVSSASHVLTLELASMTVLGPLQALRLHHPSPRAPPSPRSLLPSPRRLPSRLPRQRHLRSVAGSTHRVRGRLPGWVCVGNVVVVGSEVPLLHTGHIHSRMRLSQ